MTKIIKSKLRAMMNASLEGQLKSLKRSKESIEESKQNETKSSAGDKFETGRAMMQMELDKVSTQIDQLNTVGSQLKLLTHVEVNDQVRSGAIVFTNRGNFYIAVSLGKFILEENVFYTISPEAPLAIALMGRKVGDQLEFRKQNYKINEVY